MPGGWKTGTDPGDLNEIVVHIKSVGGFQGLLSQFDPGGLCQPVLTLQKAVINDNGGTASATDGFTLSATGPQGAAAPITISGQYTDPANPAITEQLVATGEYQLSEVVPVAGYTPSYSCEIQRFSEDGTSQTVIDDDDQNVELHTADIAVCTITNDDQPAQLTLQKLVTNDNGGSAAPADFTLVATGPTSIQGAHGSQTVTNAEVSAGSYTLSEANGPNGYTASPYICAVNGAAAVADQITLASGDQAVCTVTNDDQPATLTLQVTVQNDNGGTATDADFTLRAAGPTTIEDAEGANAVTDAEVDAGAYTLSVPTAPSGYAPIGPYSCTVNGGNPVASDNLTLVPGDVAVCTVTYRDEAAMLTLQKVLNLTHGGSAQRGDFTLTATATGATAPIVSGAHGEPPVTGAAVSAATYVLAETGGPNGYTAGPYRCSINNGAEAALTNDQITLAVGDAAVCTVTNSDQPAKLTLLVDVRNDNGGTATDNDFTLRADGPTQIEGTETGTAVTKAEVDAGAYALSVPTAPSGYAPTGSYSCTVNGGNPVSSDDLALNSGDEAVCTIVYQDQAATLTLRKVVRNEKVGTAKAEDFILATAGPTPIEGNHGSPDVTGASVKAGEYTLSEADNVPGYSAIGPYGCEQDGTALSPANTVTLGPGTTTVCTVTNLDQAATLTLLKALVNDDGGTAVKGDFVLTASGPVEKRGPEGHADVTQAQVPLGAYTLGEEGPSGYGSSLYSCVVNNTAAVEGNTLTLAANDVAVCTITNDDIRLEKTGPEEEGGLLADVAEPGETLIYTLTLTNDGDVDGLYDLVDDMDDSISYIGLAEGGAGLGEPSNIDPLEWKDVVVPARGQVAVRYKVKVADPIPDGVEMIRNCAGPGVCVEIAAAGKVTTKKAVVEEEGGAQDDLVEPGEILTFEIALINEGNAPSPYNLEDRADPHLTYIKGSANAGEPASTRPLVWRAITVPVGKPLVVRYKMKVADDLPLDVKTVSNLAYAEGKALPANFCAVNPGACVVADTVNLTLTKTAGQTEVRRGETVPFTIRAVNNAGAPMRDLTLIDTIPPGFRFMEGSATIAGKPVTPTVEGRSLQFSIESIDANGELEVQLSLQALASIEPGEYVNRAGLFDVRGRQVVTQAEARVEITVDPVFDCGDIIGRVFDDINRNGYQDPGEVGLGGVRVSTVAGLLVTTDARGRFHVACADLPARAGSNFIMKLDPRTLPAGYRIVSENPRAVRLTAGKAQRLNFAAALGRLVRVDVNDAAFAPGTTVLLPEWHTQLPGLIALLEQEPSVLRIAYVEATGDRRLAAERVKQMRRTVAEMWKAVPARYRLEIESRIEIGR
ncbi:hypothetical protein [Chelativorans xinjiangense]|uniref:hypothetical protein n=1 Tax=Chelativorans xinjiangense TaxID=2681485 RepID=UPI0024840FE8|nr:hypothetical protein [Chelativorans xinjiangense]